MSALSPPAQRLDRFAWRDRDHGRLGIRATVNGQTDLALVFARGDLGLPLATDLTV